MHISDVNPYPSGLSLRIVVATTAALLLPIALAGAVAATAPATHTVVIRQMRFTPAQLSVKPGDSVEWRNEDIFQHTVTADDSSFNSGLIQPGQAWKTTITQVGTIGYHCTPHPNMKAGIAISNAAEQGAIGEHSGAHASGSGSLRFRFPVSPEEFHPILVNFTAALLPLALLSDILGRILKQQSLHNAAWWMMLYEAALTPFTVAAGWWWKHAAGPDLPQKVITVHQWLGTAAAIIFIALAVWRWQIYKRKTAPSTAYLALALIAVVALVYQGSLGGAMLFGD